MSAGEMVCVEGVFRSGMAHLQDARGARAHGEAQPARAGRQAGTPTHAHRTCGPGHSFCARSHTAAIAHHGTRTPRHSHTTDNAHPSNRTPRQPGPRPHAWPPAPAAQHPARAPCAGQAALTAPAGAGTRQPVVDLKAGARQAAGHTVAGAAALPLALTRGPGAAKQQAVREQTWPFCSRGGAGHAPLRARTPRPGQPRAKSVHAAARATHPPLRAHTPRPAGPGAVP